MGSYRKYVKLLVIAGGVVGLDQLTKFWVGQTLPLYDSIVVVPGFFNLTHVHNPGGAFGFLAHASPLVRKFFFLFVSSLAVGVVYYLYHQTPATHRWLSAGLCLIFGGAIGNLIDRFRFDRVVDFLDFYVGSYHWPAFNVADSAITVGITIFVLHLVFNKMPAH